MKRWVECIYLQAEVGATRGRCTKHDSEIRLTKPVEKLETCKTVKAHKTRKVSVIMREYLVGEVREDGEIFKMWIRAQNEEEALRIYRWITDSTGDYMVAGVRKSFV